MGPRQDSFAFFAACHRAKSAPSIKNFRPIWTIRICSSSMILRKWRTENPAISAAFGMSRNVLFTTIPSVDFIRFLLCGEEHARAVPRRFFDVAFSVSLCLGNGHLFFTHKRIPVIGRRDEILLDRSGANPTE